MSILIYGPDRPKLGLEQSPDGSATVQVENEHTYQTDRVPPTVTFADLYDRTLPSNNKFISEGEREMEEERFGDFISHLLGMAGSAAEEKFLRLYVEYVQKAEESYANRGESYEPWSHPALIPQVWVNWYHYDSKDEKRAELAKEEPFRVDFIVKDAESGLGDNFTVIEIDGASHFGNYELDPAGNTVLESSMDAYTEHLKKDRWLRRKGWDVVRISSQEVQNLESPADFQSFYNKEMIRDPDFYVFGDELPF